MVSLFGTGVSNPAQADLEEREMGFYDISSWRAGPGWRTVEAVSRATASGLRLDSI